MIFRDLTPELNKETFSRYAKMMTDLERQGKHEAQALYNNTTQPELPDTMGDNSRKEYKVSWTPTPLARLIVKKFSNAMYGRSIERSYEDETIDKYMEEELTAIKMQAPVMCSACSALGDVAVRIFPDYFGLKYSIFTGATIVPILHPYAPDSKPVGMIYDYITTGIDEQIRIAIKDKNAESVHVQEIITRHQRDEKTGEVVIPGIRVRFIDDKKVPYFQGDAGLNPYGDFLDCSYWRNTMEFDTGRGESDILPLKRLLDTINHILTDGNLLLKWNLWPIITTTAEDDKKNPFVYGWNQVWFIGEHADGSPARVDKIEWDAKQMGGYLDFVKYLVHRVTSESRIPLVSIGDTENVSQLASGKAYEMAMTPLTDLVNERTPLYTANEYDLMATSLAVRAVVDSDRNNNQPTGDLKEYLMFEPGLGYSTPDYKKIKETMKGSKVEFGAMSMAKSPMEDAQVHSIRISAGYESEETAIRATHPEWTDEQVAEELARVGNGAPEVIDATAQARIDSITAEE